ETVGPMLDHSRAGEASAERRYTEAGVTPFSLKPGPRGGDPRGRWPANVLHDGSGEVVAFFPNAPGQQRPVRGDERSKLTKHVYGEFKGSLHGAKPRGDVGSAARFFYSAKATTAEREGSGHPTVKPIALMRWLCRLVTPPGGVVLDPFAGSGTTGVAALREGFGCVLIERNLAYYGDLMRRMASAEARAA
ncbi:MAG TPA: site-specific DNA-methyltransferase, partial [Brevundimonas sp.]|nr:site-specific DNA-methyltransferase [Brevundimonas sp.]